LIEVESIKNLMD